NVECMQSDGIGQILEMFLVREHIIRTLQAGGALRCLLSRKAPDPEDPGANQGSVLLVRSGNENAVLEPVEAHRKPEVETIGVERFEGRMSIVEAGDKLHHANDDR